MIGLNASPPYFGINTSIADLDKSIVTVALINLFCPFLYSIGGTERRPKLILRILSSVSCRLDPTPWEMVKDPLEGCRYMPTPRDQSEEAFDLLGRGIDAFIWAFGVYVWYCRKGFALQPWDSFWLVNHVWTLWAAEVTSHSNGGITTHWHSSRV